MLNLDFNKLSLDLHLPVGLLTAFSQAAENMTDFCILLDASYLAFQLSPDRLRELTANKIGIDHLFPSVSAAMINKVYISTLKKTSSSLPRQGSLYLFKDKDESITAFWQQNQKLAYFTIYKEDEIYTSALKNYNTVNTIPAQNTSDGRLVQEVSSLFQIEEPFASIIQSSCYLLFYIYSLLEKIELKNLKNFTILNAAKNGENLTLDFSSKEQGEKNKRRGGLLSYLQRILNNEDAALAPELSATLDKIRLIDNPYVVILTSGGVFSNTVNTSAIEESVNTINASLNRLKTGGIPCVIADYSTNYGVSSTKVSQDAEVDMVPVISQFDAEKKQIKAMQGSCVSDDIYDRNKWLFSVIASLFKRLPFFALDKNVPLSGVDLGCLMEEKITIEYYQKYWDKHPTAKYLGAINSPIFNAFFSLKSSIYEMVLDFEEFSDLNSYLDCIRKTSSASEFDLKVVANLINKIIVAYDQQLSSENQKVFQSSVLVSASPYSSFGQNTARPQFALSSSVLKFMKAEDVIECIRQAKNDEVIGWLLPSSHYLVPVIKYLEDLSTIGFATFSNKNIKDCFKTYGIIINLDESPAGQPDYVSHLKRIFDASFLSSFDSFPLITLLEETNPLKEKFMNYQNNQDAVCPVENILSALKDEGIKKTTVKYNYGLWPIDHLAGLKSAFSKFEEHLEFCTLNNIKDIFQSFKRKIDSEHLTVAMDAVFNAFDLYQNQNQNQNAIDENSAKKQRIKY